MKSFVARVRNTKAVPAALAALRRQAPVRGRVALALAAVLALILLEAYQYRRAEAMDAKTASQALPSFASLVERVAPAVVSIRVRTKPGAPIGADDSDGQSAADGNPFEGTPLKRFFDAPGNDDPHGKARSEQTEQQPVLGQGSGFFISADGYLVTNNHVIENAAKIDVVTSSGELYRATVVGADAGTDLALLKVESSDAFPYVALGHSAVKVGDWVIALGNPFGLEGTVTAGIVSARGRDIGMGAYDDFIQIDAPVNRGNSGGPTFNQAGEVIGVNTAIFSPTGGSVGIAFAIPIKTVEAVVAQLKAKGRVTRGWLGVQVQPVTPELADGLGLKHARGALISLAEPGSPADAAGLTRGDVILKIDDADVRDGRDMARKVAAAAPGTSVDVMIFRDGARKTLKATLKELQDEPKPVPAKANEKPQAIIAALGLSVSVCDSLPAGETGLSVLDIKPNGHAADSGLVAGDILLTANGVPLQSADDVERALLAAKRAGKRYAVAFIRRGSNELFVALSTEGV